MRHVKTSGATAVTAAGLIVAPAANAGAHTVTYTLWVDNPAPNGFSVSYVYNGTGRSTKSFPWRRFQFIFVAR